jgi:hypothetical protein
MDDGFPPHVIGFMKRKLQKEEKPVEKLKS